VLTPGNIRTQMKKQWMSKPYAMLNELPFEQFIVAVLGDYEVEETFEVGDWVHNNVTGRVAKIDDRGYDEEVAWVDDDKVNFFTQFRHATPEEVAEEKQRRWWAKHDREVWELKENDLLYYDDEFKEVEGVSEIGAIMLSSERFYLPLETIKSKYSVACFAEDRKDINGGGIE